MPYTYESLGDERFQQLCQAVLTTIYADVQCLPVGQPDGGRDALLRRALQRKSSDAVVFQIKYSKSPSSKDERDVINDLIATESAKVAKLVAKGTERYYLLTNVSGTSHHDVGSIDRVNETLTKAFSIPAFCWWRDDLDRRIDANASIKWSYPEILKGSDILQAIYEGKFGAEESRRLSAIRAYLSYQYKYDSQLKFKQVDLERGIIDLFTDVPAAAVGPADLGEREKWRGRFNLSPAFSSLLGHDRNSQRNTESRIGAVQALSDSAVAAGLPKIVIEGAPGQGKSTVTQFLCQLHRLVLLKKDWELSRVPSVLRPTEVRLPLRIDLRDYATWLSGRSPFRDANTHSAVDGFVPALESFLAAQISAQSGGMLFSPDDLLAVASNSALLIVLDGFDEVADIATRNRLVREISDASFRLEGNAISYQIIVTSRPAAFANSPGFPRDEWQHIQILPLTKRAILEYANKWISGHRFEPRERDDITSVLEEKLEYPHVRDLARNPMQLAILLALISTQGTSLPDKRTTLYDRYIDIFFNRESEKSKIVRDKRDLLVDIHRYLAWTLQVEAESDAKAGNISEIRLRAILHAYLTELGHDASLVDSLFTGMVERVVALVSRVQGTFEFEVQPLREYFAARYLYDTAPHIQAGSTRTGSIMDRFDALARNAYWLNITRFYCGCYSTGELPSLVDGLIEIGQSEQYVGTSHLSELALTLLGDYIFSQQPRSVTRLTQFLFTEDRFRIMLVSQYADFPEDSLTLPEGSGNLKLLASAIETFKGARNSDTAYASSMLIKANSDAERAIEVWREAKKDLSPENAIYYANYLDILESLPADELISLAENAEPSVLRTLFYRERVDVFTAKPNLWSSLITAVLDGHSTLINLRRNHSIDETIAAASMISVLSLVSLLAIPNADNRRQGRTFTELARRHGPRFALLGREASIPESIHKPDAVAPLAEDIISSARRLAVLELTKKAEVAHEVSVFLGLLVRDYDCRVLVIDAAIVTLNWLDESADSISYEGILANLSSLKSANGSVEIWKSRLSDAKSCAGRLLVIKAYLAWVNEEVLIQTVEQAALLMDALDNLEFHALYASYSERRAPYLSKTSERRQLRFVDGSLRDVGSSRFGAIMIQGVDAVARDQLFYETLLNYRGCDPDIMDARVSAAWKYAGTNLHFWQTALDIVAESYERGVGIEGALTLPEGQAMPLFEARAVCQFPNRYPLAVVAVAERILSERLGSQAIQVGSVAAREGWFSEPA